MRALVLGSEGFIGHHLCAALRAGGHTVDTHDLPRDDLREPGEWYAFYPSAEVVFLLAARVGVHNTEADPAGVLRDNLRIVQNVLDWLPNEGERLVFASSSEVYAGSVASGLAPIPTPEDIPLIADPMTGRGAYGLSKIAGEAMVRHTHANWTILRYHNIYGPGMQPYHVIPELWRRSKTEHPLTIPGVMHTRSFCYIDDAIEATMRLAQCPEAHGHIVNVGNPEEITIGRLAIAMLGNHPFVNAPAPGSPRRRCPDISKLTALTGFRPSVMLDEGLERTLRSFKEAE